MRVKPRTPVASVMSMMVSSSAPPVSTTVPLFTVSAVAMKPNSTAGSGSAPITSALAVAPPETISTSPVFRPMMVSVPASTM